MKASRCFQLLSPRQSLFKLPQRMLATQEPPQQKPNSLNQVRPYKADPKVSLIIRSSPNDYLNIQEKDHFNKLIRESALGLFKNYKKHVKTVSKNTDEFVINISKNMDGKSFTLLIKYMNELRQDVLENATHKLTPDSFLIFLDKMKNLTHSTHLNDLLIRKLSSINIDELKTKKMLNLYQQHSIDFKFEETLRMGEIKQFANEVIPKPRFIFDHYKVTQNPYPEEQPKQEEDYFSFFNSHEKIILKPESNFQNVSLGF
jgi:hypothetical protein